jgi:hypothetical protein
MTQRILLVGVVVLLLFGLSALATSPFSGSWEAALAISPSPFSISQFSSLLTVDYTIGGFTASSDSEVHLTGFIWQGFGITGSLGAFNVRGDVLFGPSTGDFIYDQLIITTDIAGISFGLYAAQLSSDVLGGPADGSVLRVAGSVTSLEIVNCFEMGARVEDADCDGITIYHAATGLRRYYATNPLMVGKGFTGDKLTVSGWSFACLSNGSVSLYMSDQGFDSLQFDLSGLGTGLSWFNVDVALTFQLQTKALVLTPTVNFGDSTCIDTYLEARMGSADTSIVGIELYGIGATYTAGDVTVKDVSVLDTGRYAITTEEYGSVIEDRGDAVAGGHEVCAGYWEMLSIAVAGDACCGYRYSFLADTYFASGGGLFDWAMAHLEATIPVSQALSIRGLLEVSTSGLNHLGLGVALSW